MNNRVKRTVLTLSVFAALGALTSQASAVDSEEIKVGLSYKNYQLKEDFSTGGGRITGSGSVDSWSVQYLGLTARYKDFFVLFTPALSQTKNISQLLTPSVGASRSFTFTKTRNEYDVGFGYYVTKNVAVTGGIKTLQYDTDRGPALNFANTSSCQTKYTIPMLGISGGYSFENNWFVYGNANLGVNGSTLDNCNWYRDTGVQVSNYTGKPSYQNLEGGVGYNINKNFTATLGYRSLQLKQGISVPLGGGDTTNKIYGLGAGIIYNF